MEQEILKKLEAIEDRMGRVEALSVATSQKVVELKTVHTGPARGLGISLPSVTGHISHIVIGLLYFLVYFLYSSQGILSAGTALIVMSVIMGTGIILSLQKDEMSLAAFSVALVCLTPFLYGPRAASDFGYFVYLLAFNLGILTVAFFRGWNVVTRIDFVGTVILFSAWHIFFYSPERVAIAVYALTVFYLIYLIKGLINRDLVILAANPVWFLFELYFLLQPNGWTILTLVSVAIGMTVLYAISALLYLNRAGHN